MKGDKLFDLIGKVDYRYLAELEEKPKKNSVFRWGLMAASILVLVHVFLFRGKIIDYLAKVKDGNLQVSQQTNGLEKDKALVTSNLTVDENLSIISITDFAGDGMGYAGVSVYNKEDLKGCNPWKDTWKLNVLPVYRDRNSFRPLTNVVDQFTRQEMKDKLINFGKSIGFEIEEDIYAYPYDEWELNTYKEVVENSEIKPEDLSASISYEKDGYNFELDRLGVILVSLSDERVIYTSQILGLENISSSREKLEKVGNYVLENYSNLIGLKNPKLCIEDSGIDINGEYYGHIEFYEESEDPYQDFMNYQLGTKVRLLINDQDNIYAIKYRLPDLSEKIGNYPIITLDQAIEKMENKEYVTSVPYDFMGVDTIGRIELVYFISGYTNHLLPYYEVYAETPEEGLYEGTTSYGIYYVPAVEDQYLEHLSLYDGRFN